MTMRNARLVPLLLVAACDYSGDFLFSENVEGLDDVWILTDQNGDLLVPATVDDVAQVRAATIYAEVGAPQTTSGGGVTMDFVGTGEPVCVWLDPETVTWNQSVAAQPASNIAQKFTYPDNPFDDGDLDLLGGRSVYYTGSPGETIGDFKVSYEDGLGNEIPIELISCPSTEDPFGAPSTSGHAFPEFCDIAATDVGVSYTILLQTWAVPIDDDRMSFGVLLTNGTCNDLQRAALTPEGQGPPASNAPTGNNFTPECLIQGESLTPAAGDFGPFYGYDAIANRIWPRSVEFEAQFCIDPASVDDGFQMRPFCNDEADLVFDNGEACGWEEFDGTDSTQARCFCGDPHDTPKRGAF
jgi:hypothetical protein